MKIGYARISTQQQDLSLQIDALKAANCERIFSDVATGIRQDRPELQRALDQLRTGDILVTWRLDRLGRSLKHLVQLVSDLEEKGIGFESLQEQFDTVSTGGRLIFHIFCALADFERNLIVERTKAGLEAARARGRRGGRPEKLSKSQVKTLRRMYSSQEHSVAEISRTFAVSRPTIYRYIRQSQGVI